jgi:hypothetical protein
LAAYAAGNQFSFVVANTNTAAVTINIDGMGAKAITRTGSTALVAGDMIAGQAVEIIYDGTRFQLINGNSFTNVKVSGTLAVTGVATFTAQPIASSLTASLPIFTDASKGLVSNAMTGTGSVVMSTSPTLVTPIVSSLTVSLPVFSNASNQLVSNTITGTGDVVMSTSPTLVTPALGTPTALVGTNITGTATNFTVGTSQKTDALNSATTIVNVSSSPAPTAGQVLTAQSGTAAIWGNLPGGGAQDFILQFNGYDSAPTMGTSGYGII